MGVPGGAWGAGGVLDS